jgi:hypothetical protein
MPYKDPEKCREYMRAYRRKQRERKPLRKPDTPERPVSKTDPNHVQCLEQARGRAVATPEGRGTLLHVSENYAIVVVADTIVSFPCEQVGLW